MGEGQLKGIILLVTWFVAGQAPVTSQTTFSSMQACQVGRTAILKERDRLVAEAKANYQEADAHARALGGLGLSYALSVPAVSATCVAQ